MVTLTWGQYLLFLQKNGSVIEFNVPCIFFFNFRDLFAGLGRSNQQTLPQDTRLASDCRCFHRLLEETNLNPGKGDTREKVPMGDTDGLLI